MASLDFQLVASQLSVAQINVITILRLSTCKEKGKQKSHLNRRYTHLYEFPVQKKLCCPAISNSVHIFKKCLLNVYLPVPSTSNTKTNMTVLDFKESLMEEVHQKH